MLLIIVRTNINDRAALRVLIPMMYTSRMQDTLTYVVFLLACAKRDMQRVAKDTLSFPVIGLYTLAFRPCARSAKISCIEITMAL